MGLVTVDLIYLAEHPPQANEKIVAIDTTIAAGGPATNAAVAFSYLGSEGQIVAALGQNPMAQIVQLDLQEWGTRLIDLTPTRFDPPPVSSIVVTQSTGERAVISLNATKSQVTPPPDLASLLEGVDVVLIDGHQMAVGAAIAQMAHDRQIPVVVDAGSWKPGFEGVLLWTDYVICSANFLPPQCQTPDEVQPYVQQLGVPHVAITRGSGAIVYHSAGEMGALGVPPVVVVDTLGAGDIFHGAFCHFILETDFVQALGEASKVATWSCQFFGTRNWMRTPL